MSTKLLILHGILTMGYLGFIRLHAQEPTTKGSSSPLQFECIPEDAAAGIICSPHGLFSKRELDVVRDRVLGSMSRRFPFPVQEIRLISLVAEDRPEGLLLGGTGLIFDLNIFHLLKSKPWNEVKTEQKIQTEELVHENVAFDKLVDSETIFVWPIDDQRYVIGGQKSIERSIERGAKPDPNQPHPLVH
ncbi:hypothetical protein K2X85_16900 [bacterium]|nr:hypothetical protein [bacterium]